MRRLTALIVAWISVGYNPARAQNPLPVPDVTGPIPGRIFFSTLEDLAALGYVEEEFFLTGSARPYASSVGRTDEGHGSFPYRTRIVVRRPTDPNRFNGTVLLEWLNVTVGFDIAIDWIQAREHILRQGYAWVGVSAQRAGVHRPRTGLRAWSSERYGSLDLTADSTLLRDELAFDVFTQAARVVRSAEASILGSLVPEIVLATGHSQSAIYLSEYYNRVHPLNRVIDGFLIHGGGEALADGVGTKVFKVNAETDLWRMGQAAARQPDADELRTWEVAGASHADEYYMSRVAALQERDFGSALTFECDLPPNSRIPFRYALSAAYDHLNAWVREGALPPHAPPIELAATEPGVTAARDSLGNALGGLRLPDHDVAMATNSGQNGGQPFCDLFGSHVPFDRERIDRLYSTPEDYLKRYSDSVGRALDAGYILEVDARRMLVEARRRVASGALLQGVRPENWPPR